MTSPPKPSVAVLGASADRRKYGNKAVRAYLRQGYEVFPVNPSVREVEGLKAYPDLDALPLSTLDRVTVYVPPDVGIRLLEQIAAKRPKEVWFNPGSESDELLSKAEALGLPVITACSILDVGAHPSDFGDA
jgi:predicted CoA-binding protein